MNLGTHPFRAALAVAAAGCLIAGVAQPATAAPPDAVPSGVPQLEALDRGLVAVSTTEGVFLSWRLLASEATGATDTGLAGPDFAVYRDGEQIAVVTDSTNYADAAGSATAQYTVAPVVNGIELEASAPVSAWAQGYYDLPLQKPADGVSPKSVAFPDGQPYTYSANDVSVGDVDGDGAYEYVVKWDPSNSQDVSIRRLHRPRLHRHLRARRHAAEPPRPRQEHPRRRPLHAVPRLRLRRRRPVGDDAEDRARHEVDHLRRRRHRRERVGTSRCPSRTSRPGTRTPTTTA